MSDTSLSMQGRVPYLLVRSFSMLIKEYEERASEQEKEDGSDFGEALDMLELAITKICANGLEVEG